MSAEPAAVDLPPPGRAPTTRDPPFVRRGAGASAALAGVALSALLANCLLTSPPRFSEGPGTAGDAWLRPVVEALGLYARYPTPRGVEIRNLVFFTGAAALSILAGVMLLARRGPRPALLPDEFDLDDLATRPAAWLMLMMTASALGALFSAAQPFALGGTAIRAAWLAWWWPLAALLTARHAQRVAAGLTGVLAVTAALGLAYYAVRGGDPTGRLAYPFLNAGWTASCLLPGFVIAGTWVVFSAITRVGKNALPSPPLVRGGWGRVMSAVAAALVLGAALSLTRTRAAYFGIAAAGFAALFLRAGRLARTVMVLLALAAVSAGGWYVQCLRAGGSIAQRAEALRSRFDYEWPYAWRLFVAKPVLGHGESGYVRLAGQMARDDQFREPAITAMDHAIWPASAHNEYLELLADLGLVGAGAFVAALAVTFLAAARAVRTGHSSPQSTGQEASRPCRVSSRGRRALIVGLAAALAGMSADAFFSASIRSPGLPPIFLTVWAALWALIRPATDAAAASTDEVVPPPPSNGRTPAAAPDGAASSLTVGPGRTTPRRFPTSPRGWAAVLCGAAVAWLGLADWRAARHMHDAEAALTAGRSADAVVRADFAARHRLEPFRRLTAWVLAARSRAERLRSRLLSDPAPPDDPALNAGHECLAVLERLEAAAPRFLQSATIEAEAARGLVTAYERLGRPREVRAFRERVRRAFERERRDEPFDLRAVESLWQAAPDAPAIERLMWLRGVCRAGFVDERWERLLEELRGRPDFRPALEDLLSLARQDRLRPPDSWSDVLSPETFRVAARERHLAGDVRIAVDLCSEAEAMYVAALPRLRGGRAAALLELSRYRFAALRPAGPRSSWSPSPGDLAEIRSMLLTCNVDAGAAGDIERYEGPGGRLWLAINLALRPEPDLREALRAAAPGPETDEWESRLADGYGELVRLFLPTAGEAGDGDAPDRRDSSARDECIAWARRAAQIAPDRPQGGLLLAESLADAGRLDEARTALDGLTRRFPDHESVIVGRARLLARYPGLSSDGAR